MLAKLSRHFASSATPWSALADTRRQADRCRGERVTGDSRSLAGLDPLIHDPSRLMILTVLYKVAEANFVYLQTWGYTPGNLSSHLAKLQRAGYVALHKRFKGRYPLTACSMTKRGREALESYARMLKCTSAATSKSENRGS
jgi:DNA-binding transcriptional ArsR family regulator